MRLLARLLVLAAWDGAAGQVFSVTNTGGNVCEVFTKNSQPCVRMPATGATLSGSVSCVVTVRRHAATPPRRRAAAPPRRRATPHHQHSHPASLAAIARAATTCTPAALAPARLIVLLMLLPRLAARLPRVRRRMRPASYHRAT